MHNSLLSTAVAEYHSSLDWTGRCVDPGVCVCGGGGMLKYPKLNVALHLQIPRNLVNDGHGAGTTGWRG